MGTQGIKTVIHFKPPRRQHKYRKQQTKIDAEILENAKKWKRLPSNKPGWKPNEKVCPYPGCLEKPSCRVLGCKHGRIACEAHAYCRCTKYQCTCRLQEVKERAEAEEKRREKLSPRKGLSYRYALVARTRPKGTRILADLEGTPAVYVITWVSQDLDAYRVTNRCTHGAIREREVGEPDPQPWELDLTRLKHSLLPNINEAYSDESDDGADGSEDLSEDGDSENEDDTAANEGILASPADCEVTPSWGEIWNDSVEYHAVVTAMAGTRNDHGDSGCIAPRDLSRPAAKGNIAEGNKNHDKNKSYTLAQRGQASKHLGLSALMSLRLDQGLISLCSSLLCVRLCSTYMLFWSSHLF